MLVSQLSLLEADQIMELDDGVQSDYAYACMSSGPLQAISLHTRRHSLRKHGTRFKRRVSGPTAVSRRPQVLAQLL